MQILSKVKFDPVKLIGPISYFLSIVVPKREKEYFWMHTHVHYPTLVRG